MQRALLAGGLAAVTCSVVGTWVVLRGLSFMGDALAHGIIPGVAIAVLAGFDVMLGASLAAVVTAGGIALVGRRTPLPEDTSIGLLFVGMLSLGVLVISRSGSYAGDLTQILFGAVLGVIPTELLAQAIACALALVASLVLYRPLLALSFDPRKAQMLGLRPELARIALLLLIAVAVVSSFRAVGALLVFGLLIAPPAAASLLVRRVPVMMAVAVALGVIAVAAGLILSFHFDLAAGPSMAGTAVVLFFVALAARELRGGFRLSTVG